MSQRVQVEIEGRELSLSNLDKVLYPKVGFTKAQVIDYYTRIAPLLLPHLKGRPLTMKRYPNGVEGEFFYEKACPKHRPPWVKTHPIYSHGRGRHIDFCLFDDLPTLVWAANLADLELHTSLSVAEKIKHPNLLVFDLDPGPPANLKECCQLALIIREILAEVDLQAFPKVSGNKGLQLYIPLGDPTVTYEQTKAFSKGMALYLEERYPDRVVSRMLKELRKGKVFVDWSQNDEHKTTICVYSLRARERPTVSAPVSWNEVEQLAERGDVESLIFDAPELLKRVEKKGDLFEPLLSLHQHLPKHPKFLRNPDA